MDGRHGRPPGGGDREPDNMGSMFRQMEELQRKMQNLQQARQMQEMQEQMQQMQQQIQQQMQPKTRPYGPSNRPTSQYQRGPSSHPKSRQPPKNASECGNCCRNGHEVKDCIEASSRGVIDACPIHNDGSHNLWTCRGDITENRLDFYLITSRNGKPQLSWGRDIFRDERLVRVMKKKDVTPLTREFVIQMAKRDPDWYRNYQYNLNAINDRRWVDPAWKSRSFPDQSDPILKGVQRRSHIKRCSPQERRSASPEALGRLEGYRQRSPPRSATHRSPSPRRSTSDFDNRGRSRTQRPSRGVEFFPEPSPDVKEEDDANKKAEAYASKIDEWNLVAFKNSRGASPRAHGGRGDGYGGGKGAGVK